MTSRISVIIMLDSEHSLVTYTSVPSPVEDYSDIGLPEVDRPPSPDYVLGSEEPEQTPLSPDYDDVFPSEEQPLPIAATPTANSPGYIPEFDPKGYPEEDDKKDPEEDPAAYPADSTVVALPVVDHVPSEEVTKPLPQIPSPPLPIPSPPPNSPTHIEIFKSCLPLWKRLHFASPTPSQEVEESSVAGAARQDEPAVARDDPYSLVREELYGFVDRVDVAPGRSMSKELGYGITDTWDELAGANEEIVPTTLQGKEARMAHEAWGLSMDASDNAHSDVMSLHTTLVAQHALILDLQAANRRRQSVIKELLAADHKRQKMAPKRTTRSTLVITTPTLKTTTLVTNAQLQAMIDQGVIAALAARDANRNGDDSHTSGTGRPVISSCTVACQVKFATCTLQGNALTWWNSYVKTTTPEASHVMPWRTLKKMMTDKYCPSGEIKKLESEMWNLKVKGYFKKECPKLKNNNNRCNQVGNAKGVCSRQGRSKPGQQCRHRRIVGLNTIIRGCTLNFLNHPFNIDLIPVELGSFNVIIGMDWLTTYHAVIVCHEKIVRVPFRNETLIIRCDGSNNGTQLNIISCIKTRKYLLKGYPVFLANITTKMIKDKSEEKRLENVLIVRDFSKVFPKDLPGLPPTRHVEFQIDLIPGASPVARAPYQLAPSEVKELSDQLQELSDKGFIRPSSSPWGALIDLRSGYHQLRVREVIIRFSKIAKPMTKLTQKKVMFDWGDKQEAAFQLLKQKLCSAPILALPEGAEDFVAYCDAPHKGLGAVLMQKEKVM
nr:reverse transcriptase domain-containing protein [Tanacetum cinerariifolium]